MKSGVARQEVDVYWSIGLYFVHTGNVALQVSSSTPPACSLLLSGGCSPNLSAGQQQCAGPHIFLVLLGETVWQQQERNLAGGTDVALSSSSYLPSSH